jgi:hypothetical protein
MVCNSAVMASKDAFHRVRFSAQNLNANAVERVPTGRFASLR